MNNLAGSVFVGSFYNVPNMPQKCTTSYRKEEPGVNDKERQEEMRGIAGGDDCDDENGA
jgi:hypothetical protein